MTDKQALNIGAVPALLWGAPSEKGWLCVHGQGGNKEEAQLLADVACPRGYQVLSVDLPEHGERAGERGTFDPQHAVPELRAAMAYARTRWKSVSLYANSIGAWFGMLGLARERPDSCLFVSPILDMKALIENMMRWADVTEERLKAERRIETSFGQTLDWEYRQYVLAHPIEAWDAPTSILYGGRDHLTDRATAEGFARRFGCALRVMENGEHWFHTDEQLAFLRRWLEDEVR